MVAATDRFEYVENTAAFVGMQRGKTVLLGKLDHAGNFLRDCASPPLRLGSGQSGAPPYELINFRRPGRIHVYEYRSGRLVKGALDNDGNFVPDVGSQVIDSKDYHYNKGALHIYNLPGKFVPRKK